MGSRSLPAWAAVATLANFALLAIPVATYPVTRHSAEFAGMIGPKDLLVTFAHYPGRPYPGFLELKGLRSLPVDLRLEESGAVADVVLPRIDAELTETLRGGGRVLVADMLNPLDWEAPWMSLLGRGVTKKKLEQSILHDRSAKRLADVGGIKIWELTQTGPAVARQ